MKKALLLALGSWLLIIGVYYLALRNVLESPANWICAVLGGTFLAILVGSVRAWFRSKADVRLIRDAVEGRPRVDQRQVAVAGRIVATGSTLRAPSSDAECVAYEYEVAHTETYTVSGSDDRDESRIRRVVDLSGIAIVPCVIESPSGKIKLCGFPLLEAYPGAETSDPQSFDNLARHCSAHPPKESTGVAQFKSLGEMASALRNDGSGLQADWKLTKTPLRSAGQEIKEKVVAPGDPVVAFGVYDAGQQALISREGWGASYNRLYPGSPDDAIRQVAKGGLVLMLIAMGFFILFHTFLGVIVTRMSH